MDWARLADPTVWEFWLGLGFIFAIMEVLDGSFFLHSLGLGFMATAVPAALGVDSLGLLLLLCAVFQLSIFALLRPIARRALNTDVTPTNVDALVGAQCVVIQPIGGPNDAGYVRIGSEEWRALSHDDASYDAGQEVLIENISGATVYVRSTD